jgi:hypothetical protein
MNQFEPMPFKMGELIRMGNVFLTLNNFEAMLSRNPNNKLVIIDVTIENEGMKAIEYDSKEFILRGRKGSIYYQTEPKEEQTLGKKTLLAHSKTKDRLIFEIPMETYAELVYKPVWWDGEPIMVELR